MENAKKCMVAALCALLLLAFTGCSGTRGEMGTNEQTTVSSGSSTSKNSDAVTTGTQNGDQTHKTGEPTAEDGDLTDDLFAE
ncbi:MAG: hypothetical protein ACI39E_00205 [Acutalibacteraceae bacterium]